MTRVPTAAVGLALPVLALALVASGFGLIAAASGGTGGGSSGNDPLTLQLNWTPYAADHAFYYYGVEQGIYADEGIDLKVQPGNGSATVLKLVGNGSQPVALVDVGSMVKGVAQGMDVTSTAVITQTSPMALIYKQDSPIKTAEDLRGSRIALTQGDALSQVFPAVLAANGLSKSDVDIISVANAGAKETAVLQGRVDALLGYYTDQPLRMEHEHGVPMGWTPFSELGVNTFNMALVMNTDWMERNRDLATRFISATQRAIRATVENPEAAADAFSAANPTFDRDLALREITETIPLLHTPASEGKPIGWTAEEDWRTTLQVLSEHAGVATEEPATYYTNELVEEGQ